MKGLLNKLSSIVKSKYYFYAICVLFGSCFFFVPFFQINRPIIVWFAIVILLSLVLIYCFFYNLFKIDIILICFLLYAIIGIITTICNRLPIIWTMPLLQFLLATLYLFFRHDKNSFKAIPISALIGLSLFVFVLIIKEHSGIINYFSHKNYYRLGSSVGDENEIGMFLAFGACLSIYYSFFSPKLLFKISSSFSALIFAFASILTGSKEAVFSITIILVLIIFMFFGRKRWFISAIVVVVLVSAFIIMLSLPIFSSFSERFFSMISFMAGVSNDSSTSQRLVMFINGLELFSRRPIFGFGIRAYYYYSCVGGGGWSHNTISEVLCSYGIVGFFLFLVPFVFSIAPPFLKRRIDSIKLPLLIVVFLVLWFATMSIDTLKIFPFVFSFACASISKLKKPFLKHNSFLKLKI